MLILFWILCAFVSFVWIQAEGDKSGEATHVFDYDDKWWIVVIIILGPIGLTILAAMRSKHK